MAQPIQPQGTEFKTVNLFDWSGGIVNKRTNPMAYPESSLWGGTNISVSDKWLQARAGIIDNSASAILAGATIEQLQQVRFPITNKSFLLAQARSTSECKLYASNTLLPSTAIAFTEIYDLGLTAGMVSIATLNDRAIITEGIANPPLVFLGGMSTDASDFARPMKIFGTFDSINFFDMTNNLTDADPTTQATLNAMPSAGGVYINTDVRTVSGFYFEVETPNTTICDLLVFRWDGIRWVNIPAIIDNTKVAGCTLAQSGTVTWAEQATEFRDIVEVPGYWHKITFSITGGSNTSLTNELLVDQDVVRQDYRGTITSWSYDAPFVGRFHNTGGGVVTPAAGLLMSRVYFADDSSSIISSITGNYVWLEHNKPSQAISEINYGDVTSDSQVVPNSFLGGGYKGWYAFDRVNNANFWRSMGSTGWLKVDLGATGAKAVNKYHVKSPLFVDYAFPKDYTLQGSNDDSNWITLNTRTSVADPGQDTEITPVKFTNTTAYRYYKLNVTDRNGTGDISVGEMRLVEGCWYTEDMGTAIIVNKYSIQAPNTTTYSFPANWTFAGSNDNSSWTTLDTRTSQTDPGQNIWTSYYTFTNATAYQYYKLNVTAETSATKDVAIQTLKLVESIPVNSLVTQVATSVDTTQLAATNWEAVVSAAITQTTPGASTIYHTVSFDDRATWKVFVSSAWKTIAYNNSGTWQYDSGAGLVNATVNTELDALKQAFEVTSNRWTKTLVEAMTEANWTQATGFTTSVTVVDWAVGMKAATTNIPIFDKIVFTNKQIATEDITSDADITKLDGNITVTGSGAAITAAYEEEDDPGTTTCTATMTSNTAPSPNVMSATVNNNNAFWACDGDERGSSDWQVGNNTNANIMYNFGSGHGERIVKIELTAYYVGSWTFQGTNNESAVVGDSIDANGWTTLTTGEVLHGNAYYSFTNTTSYERYRLVIVCGKNNPPFTASILIRRWYMMKRLFHIVHPVATLQPLTSSNTTQINCTDWTHIDIGVTASELTPGSSAIYHSVSFDARNTFSVFKSSAWRSIVRNNSGTFQYKDSGTSWHNSSTNSALGALAQALAISQNQMSRIEMEAITLAQWEASGGFTTDATTMDFGAGLLADGDNVPVLSYWEVTAQIPATYDPANITTNVSVKDYKSTIGKWNQSSTAIGRFETSGSVPVAVNTLLEAGLQVTFSDTTTASIMEIIGDGTAVGGVVLSADHADGNVSSITGVIYSSGLAVSNYSVSDGALNYSVTLAFPDTITDTLAVDAVPVMTSDVLPSPIVITSSGYPQYAATALTGTTVIGNCIALGTLATVSTITATQVTPGSSAIYHALSFDGQITWKVYTAGAWRSIAKLDTTYQYNSSTTSTPSWSVATVQTQEDCINQSMAVTQNKMTAATMNALVIGNYAEANGPVAGDTVDFAFKLVPDGVNLPSLSKYVVLDAIAAGVVTTEISKITYKAPCQLLRNIPESGVPDYLVGMAVWKYATNSIYDYSVNIADGSFVTTAILSALTTNDYVYCGGVTPFSGAKLLITEKNQVNTATLIGSYWNGTEWKTITIDDGTKSGGKTLNQSGVIRWAVPDDWKDTSPVSGALTQAYWIRFSPSGTLSATVEIAEARVFTQPLPISKHRFVSSYDNRLVLGNQLSAKDQVDLSRPYEEYGFCGSTTVSMRLGAQDGIVALKKIYDQVWLAKGDDWFALSVGAASSLVANRGDASSQMPINNQCCIVAPLDSYGRSVVAQVADGKNRTGLYFLNYAGAWCFTGTELYKISEKVSWWMPNAVNPRIDLDYLQESAGVYWAEKSWIIWAVPMITGTGTSQATNNYMIVYDLNLGVWQPMFDIPAKSLCQAVEYKTDNPEKVGAMTLLVGGQDGHVYRLFSPTATTDDGTAIASSAETGWLGFGASDIEKILRTMHIYGSITSGDLTLEVRIDGEATTDATRTFTLSSLSLSPTKAYVLDFSNRNITANMFKFILSWSGPGSIYGCQLEVGAVRGWPITGT